MRYKVGDSVTDGVLTGRVIKVTQKQVTVTWREVICTETLSIPADLARIEEDQRTG